ncbi:MAG: winged helix-turn-helix transcriptional regulator [Candidatus Sericytochromatia bacterium]|nr:winged helix-turn-helix transcriptional regulator [Candidatus Sericytochromatia bacterium]
MVAQGRAKAGQTDQQPMAMSQPDNRLAGDTEADEEVPADGSLRMPQAAAAMVPPVLAEQLAEIFRALSDPTRVRLVSALSVGELAVWELTELLGITQAAVSHQLRFLRFLKLVKARKVGKSTLYSLCDRHVMSLFAEAHEHVIEGAEDA